MNRFTIIEPHRLSLYEAEALQAEIDRIENIALWYRKQARKARVWAFFKRIINSDAFFIVTGGLMAFDIGFLLWVLQR